MGCHFDTKYRLFIVCVGGRVVPAVIYVNARAMYRCLLDWSVFVYACLSMRERAHDRTCVRVCKGEHLNDGFVPVGCESSSVCLCYV